MKKRTKRIVWIMLAVLVLLIVVVLMVTGGNNKDTGPATVSAERRNIIDQALAVGSIEPINEIAVKSKISGVVGEMFVELGDLVQKDDPLLEVRPNPTPLELVEASRNVEMKKIVLKTLVRELKRNEELKEKNLISDYDFEVLRQDYDQAVLSVKIAEEQLDLMESGKVMVDDRNIETVIKSPITGYILEKSVNLGDPVVPLTSYQAGTELMKLANMDNLLFKGTVDEIDVGKITEGMTAEIQIGALPGQKVIGHVTLISLKARKEDNSTVFPVEIVIDEVGGATLRAGFSANANVIIARKDSVLAIPERVVTFRNDSTFIHLPGDEDEKTETLIRTGLSDAIYIEVLEGLEEGQKVLEKEVKEIL